MAKASSLLPFFLFFLQRLQGFLLVLLGGALGYDRPPPLDGPSQTNLGGAYIMFLGNRLNCSTGSCKIFGFSNSFRHH